MSGLALLPTGVASGPGFRRLSWCHLCAHQMILAISVWLLEAEGLRAGAQEPGDLIGDGCGSFTLAVEHATADPPEQNNLAGVTT